LVPVLSNTTILFALVSALLALAELVNEIGFALFRHDSAEHVVARGSGPAKLEELQ
jgi:hypothetical protein